MPTRQAIEQALTLSLSPVATGEGCRPGALWARRGEGQLLPAPQRLQRIKMLPGRFGAADLQITDQLSYPAREWQR